MLVFTGNWLRRRREEIHFSQAVFAKCVGTTVDVIKDMENGELILDADLIKRIYIFLGEHLSFDILTSQCQEIICDLRDIMFVYGETKEIYISYKQVPYECVDDFYDFIDFAIDDKAFERAIRVEVFKQGRISCPKWIKTDIKTAVEIFELQILEFM